MLLTIFITRVKNIFIMSTLFLLTSAHILELRQAAH
jgi:hypothetical protein